MALNNEVTPSRSSGPVMCQPGPGNIERRGQDWRQGGWAETRQVLGRWDLVALAWCREGQGLVDTCISLHLALLRLGVRVKEEAKQTQG